MKKIIATATLAATILVGGAAMATPASAATQTRKVDATALCILAANPATRVAADDVISSLPIRQSDRIYDLMQRQCPRALKALVGGY